jgi:hypothetical protein
MRNETPDRQQMHEELKELKELAKLAGTPNPAAVRGPAHECESADSSGYVDLSAFRADDENWVERELARAKAGGGQRTIDGLAPQSMAPVALEALLAADEKLDDEAPQRRRWPLAIAGIASVAAVAALAFVVTRNAPHTAKATQAAAVAPPPAATQPVSAPEPTPAQAPETAAQAPSAAPSTATPTEPTPAVAAEKPHATHASRGHAPAAAPAAVAAKPPAARPAAVPVSPPVKSSGDSLMDAIRAAVK